jgi:taurine dioxygenase
MEVVPLGHALGVEIRGVDITGAVTDADIGSIREAWHRAHVIVFRGVEWTPDQHIAFSRRFRGLDDHAATPHDTLEGYPELLEITNIPKNGQPSQTRNHDVL